MSEDFREYLYQLPVQRRNPSAGTAAPSSSSHVSADADLQMFDPNNSYKLSFTKMLHGSTDYPSSLSPNTVVVRGGGETPATPNSSISSSSTEDSGKGKKEAKGKGEDHVAKKEGKSKNKGGGEKKERAPRFAFMTKSEVDHLEDGYKWRKYGQKAVKHSPYPRSYYRCNTRKCEVKKRVERSYQDPSIVITTYEGQHNHHIPMTLRGSMATGMFASSMLSPSMMLPPTFPQDLSTPTIHHNLYGHDNTNNLYYIQNMSSLHHQPQQFHQVPDDYGLLHDMFPPTLSKFES